MKTISSSTRRGTHSEYLRREGISQDEVRKQYGGRFLVKGEFHPTNEFEPKEVSNSLPVYGINLKGENEYDAHNFNGQDVKDQEYALIEKVASLLGKELTLREKFIAAYAKGYIPAMTELGKSLGLDDNQVNDIIDDIKSSDTKMQNIPPEAEEFISKLSENSLYYKKQSQNLQEENKNLKEANANQKTQIEKLRGMLKRALDFAIEVRDSVVGKIFFKKPLKTLDIDGQLLPEREEREEK